MWIDLNYRERQNYMRQTDGAFIPGYTGHCPMLKFRFSKTYGNSTREIKREIRSRKLFQKPMEYRPEDRYEIEHWAQREMALPDRLARARGREAGYITGYTGYIPGLNFRYGKSYGRTADDSMADFDKQQREFQRREDITKSYVRSRSAPRMASIHTRDEVQRTLKDYKQSDSYKETSISAEFPPIAGYTGHIPRIKGSEASLSQRFHCAAKRGLELIQQERTERTRLQDADRSVKEILREAGKRSYCNWG